jgi:tetrahydromethanopterin S-methyltransferase subunit H
LLKSQSQTQENTRKVKAQTAAQTVEARADGKGQVSHAGACLLLELAERAGLAEALLEAVSKPLGEGLGVAVPNITG